MASLHTWRFEAITAMGIRAGAVAAVIALAIGACGGPKYTTVTLPPLLDLTAYGRTALPTFTIENARGDLHELATRRFSQRVLHAAGGIEVLEIGDARPVLQRVGETTFGPAAAKAVGADHHVPVVFSGHLKVSNVKPGGGLVGLSMPFVEATVTVDLTIGLYSTTSGGTIWRSGASLTEKIGQLAIVGGEPSFSATDPNAAYTRLVDRLVAIVTRDLYPTYERRRI